MKSSCLLENHRCSLEIQEGSLLKLLNHLQLVRAFKYPCSRVLISFFLSFFFLTSTISFRVTFFLGCTVDGQQGNGEKRGTCKEHMLCQTDGSCKLKVCTVDGSPGNGASRGTCEEHMLCQSDGSCKKKVCTVEGSPGNGASRGTCEYENEICFSDGSCKSE